MDRCLVRWLLSAVAIIACVESHGSPADFDFIGSSHWAQSYRQTCENPPTRYHENPSLLCYRRFVRLSPVDIEVLSRFPLLLHYHKLITADNARSFVRMAEARTITEQLVVQDDNPKIHQTHDSRRANGTWMRHEEEGIVRTLYRQVQERLALNLRAAEDWQVLMYEPGGHYAPHYDYLIDNGDPTMYDWWMVNFGNRIATFLLVLETATKGGGTIFPYLDITIMPEAGDAILWFNMQPDGTRAHTSLHGACPIREGRKVAATLWVRVRGQEFMAPCPSQPTVAYELEPFLARI